MPTEASKETYLGGTKRILDWAVDRARGMRDYTERTKLTKKPGLGAPLLFTRCCRAEGESRTDRYSEDNAEGV